MRMTMASEARPEVQLALVIEEETGAVLGLREEQVPAASVFEAMDAHDEREREALEGAIGMGLLRDDELRSLETKGREELAVLRDELDDLIEELSAFVSRLNGDRAVRRLVA